MITGSGRVACSSRVGLTTPRVKTVELIYLVPRQHSTGWESWRNATTLDASEHVHRATRQHGDTRGGRHIRT